MPVLPDVDCGRAVDGSPCAVRQGRVGCDMTGCCEHCGLHAADLLVDVLPKYGALLAGVRGMQARLREAREGVS
jgi:hypothetical protein